VLPALKESLSKHKRPTTLSQSSSLSFGSFNVKTSLSPLRLEQLVDRCENKNICLLAVQEHKLKGANENQPRDTVMCQVLKNGWKFYYSSCSAAYKAPQGGVGFLVSGLVDKHVVGFEVVSERIMKLKFRSSNKKLGFTAFSVYSPTSVHEHEIEARLSMKICLT
jgi:hypothetical protein